MAKEIPVGAGARVKEYPGLVLEYAGEGKFYIRPESDPVTFLLEDPDGVEDEVEAGYEGGLGVVYREGPVRETVGFTDEQLPVVLQHEQGDGYHYWEAGIVYPGCYREHFRSCRSRQDALEAIAKDLSQRGGGHKVHWTDPDARRIARDVFTKRVRQYMHTVQSARDELAVFNARNPGGTEQGDD